MPSLSIVVPNYNGAGLLPDFVLSVRDYVDDCEVVVVDDASSDDSVELLGRLSPQVRVIGRSTNGGFSAAVNDGIRATSGEFVVLLNNDVEVTPAFLDTILPVFADEDVFSVSPSIIIPSRGDLDEGAKTGFWHHGIFYTGQRQGVTDLQPVLYTTGCAAVYRRSMLERLDGFDEIYSPFYWEDIDLCYRAWKRGWRSLYQPASAVCHRHSASISKLQAGFTGRIKSRNSLLFLWRNISDDRLIAWHRRWLPLILAKRAALGDRPFVRGYMDAYALRHACREANEIEEAQRKLSDREILAVTGVCG